jgi:hypothetical protein
MIQKFQLQPWSSVERQIQLGTLFIAFIWYFSILSFVVLFYLAEEEFEVPLFAILTIGIMPIVALMFWYARRMRDIERKVFRMPLATALNVVGSIIKEKGMPYQGNYREGRWNLTQVVFRFEHSNLTIRIYEQSYRYSPLTMIEMRPVTDENRPMVKSLQQKISQTLLSDGIS